MKQITTRAEQKENRAVSPVIGVILMVAITVILAAVIGAFVLEIGDQQETAPSTSFDTEETDRFYNFKDGSTPYPINLSHVSITHAGGETLSVTQTDIKVDGNGSVFGADNVEYDASVSSRRPLILEPQPNFCDAAGSNDRVEFTSGQSWHIDVHGNSPPGPDPGVYDGGGQALPSDENFDCQNGAYVEGYKTGGLWNWYLRDSGGSQIGKNQGVLQQGDAVTVVWTASSGGKTQTLQKYTVQSSAEVK